MDVGVGAFDVQRVLKQVVEEKKPALISAGFCVWDEKAENSTLPWYAPTIAVAIRMFTSECENPESDFHKHPEDYSLWKTCEFDQTTRSTVGIEPVCVARAIDVRGPEREA